MVDVRVGDEEEVSCATACPAQRSILANTVCLQNTVVPDKPIDWEWAWGSGGTLQITPSAAGSNANGLAISVL